MGHPLASPAFLMASFYRNDNASLEYHGPMVSSVDTYYTYATAHGPLTLRATGRGIAEIAFGQVALDGRNVASALTNQAATELQEYLAGKRRRFDVPIDPQGSAFQKEVWTEVCAIGYGEVRTAAQVAEAIGKPGSHRSVGTAIRMNRLAPLVPTHRISAANATGKQAKIFRALVALEQRVVAED